jgi:hypothetical protein
VVLVVEKEEKKEKIGPGAKSPLEMERQASREFWRLSPPTTLGVPWFRRPVACSSARTKHGGFTASHVFLAALWWSQSATRHCLWLSSFVLFMIEKSSFQSPLSANRARLPTVSDTRTATQF